MDAGIAGASGQTPLNLDNEQGELWPCAFTPFNGFDAMFSVGTNLRDARLRERSAEFEGHAVARDRVRVEATTTRP